MTIQPVLIDGEWRAADSNSTFQSSNPSTGQLLEEQWPVSSWADCDAALNAAARAADELRQLPPVRIAEFLEAFAAEIENRAEAIVAAAHAETALPVSPRLADVELPRTTGQLRQAATAARDGSWALPTIDTATGIRAVYGPLGPVCVFGPNNFPLAFGSVSGGDFAAAIAAGNPVIGKANSSHPLTTKLVAEAAQQAVNSTGLPAATVQLIYRTTHADGERLVADARVGATGYTGSREAGLKLKAAADAAGKPIYLELSSINPVVILPGAIAERQEEIAQEFSGSCLMGTGQFCTNPGMVMLVADAGADDLVKSVVAKFDAAPVGTLLSESVQTNLARNIDQLVQSGAELLTKKADVSGPAYRHPNTVLRVNGDDFERNSEQLQCEVFGNATVFVVARDPDQLTRLIDHLEGNLTGCVYSAKDGSDDPLYDNIVHGLRKKVGRLLNDKMPTGVAVSAAMNHGGPYPATGHPGFTAVGIPASLLRFSMLHCYDNVRAHRLPPSLHDANPTGNLWRCIDGQWTLGPVSAVPVA